MFMADTGSAGRADKSDVLAMSSLASLSENLEKLRFRGPESIDAIINLQAKNVREIGGDRCRELTDSTLRELGARYESLECLQIGPDLCERITSEAIKSIAISCPKLKKFWISGLREVNADGIIALAKNCKNLRDIGFVDCRKVDEAALGNIASLRFLSVAGTSNIKWDSAVEQWSKLPNLIGLDVSRTDISPHPFSRIFSSSSSLKVLCALNCVALEEDAPFGSNDNYEGKVSLAVFNDIFEGVANLFVEMPKRNDGNNHNNMFLHLRDFSKKDKELDEFLNWIEWVICNSLLRVCESNPSGLDDFWLGQGVSLLLSLTQSEQEEVQERAATALATFVAIANGNVGIAMHRAEAVMQHDGVRLLLYLARSSREWLQSEACKAITYLSVNAAVAKAVVKEGGIAVLSNIASSVNRLAVEAAVGGLWNLAVGGEHKAAIAEVGGIQALVDLIFKWSRSTCGEPLLECAAGALANLAGDDKLGTEIASAGGVHALVMLARSCTVEGVQQQAARALANLATYGDSNSNCVTVGQEPGALDTLMQLTRSPHDGVKQEAAGALWKLCFDARNLEPIAAAGGVEALVALARSCSNASHCLQERAAGALWGLSSSEANRIAIVQEGGVAPLIALARSDAEDVHEAAAGALENLAFNPGSALRIVEEGGVPVLVHLCTCSVSKMARFVSAMALAYMFDGRMDEIALKGTSTVGTSKRIRLDGARQMALQHIEAFVTSFSDLRAFSTAAVSSASAALAKVTKSACIQKAGHLGCSGAMIERFVAMLRNPCPALKSFAAFALLQFIIPGGRNAARHASLLHDDAALQLLREVAAAGAPLEAKVFARVVLRNLEQHQME